MVKPRAAFERGDHVCAVYASVEELADVVAKFLAEGLSRHERCWYVAAADEGPAVRNALSACGVNVDVEVTRGALAIIEGSGAYVVRGDFDPEHTIAAFSDAIEQALTDGFSGFRAAADMSWALTLQNVADRVVAYEALLRTLFATCRVTGLCLYHRERMPFEILNGALVTHPLVGLDGHFQRNPFYEPEVTAMPHAEAPAVIAKLQSLSPTALG
jgi:hypothetical protein